MGYESIDRFQEPTTAARLDLAASGWQRRAADRRQARLDAPMRMPLQFTEADKYRWIRANRNCFDIIEALHDACRDADFDAKIESAMRTSVTSPSYFGGLDELPPVAV